MGHEAVELDEIVLGRVREICERFDGVDEDALQDRPLFRVGRRRFAIFNGLTSPSRSGWDLSAARCTFSPIPPNCKRCAATADSWSRHTMELEGGWPFESTNLKLCRELGPGSPSGV